MQLNIWYVNPYAGGPTVGRYWRAFHLANAWAASGHSIEILCPGYHHLMDEYSKRKGRVLVQGIAYNFLSGVMYRGNGLARLVSMLYFPIAILLFAARSTGRPKPDLIVYSSAHPFGYPAALLLAKFYRAKIYFEVRDIWPLSLVEISGFSRYHPLIVVLSFLEKLAYRTADSIISLLPGALPHMMSQGMHREKFRYCPNGYSAHPGVLPDVIPHKMLADLSRLKSEGYFIFFYAGALGEPNAMHHFIDALEIAQFPEQHRVKFVIVGKGEQAEELILRCDKLDRDLVLFYPQVDKWVIQRSLKIVDAAFFVMHDLPIYRFGISLNKLYDYMSAAVPVVGAFQSFNNPIVDCRCGIWVSPSRPQELAHAFEQMLVTSQITRKKMGENGKCFLDKNYDYSFIADKFLQ